MSNPKLFGNPSFCDANEAAELLLKSKSFDTAHAKYLEEFAMGGFWPEATRANTEDLEESEYKTLRMAYDKIRSLDIITRNAALRDAQEPNFKFDDVQEKLHLCGIPREHPDRDDNGAGYMVESYDREEMLEALDELLAKEKDYDKLKIENKKKCSTILKLKITSKEDSTYLKELKDEIKELQAEHMKELIGVHPRCHDRNLLSAEWCQ